MQNDQQVHIIAITPSQSSGGITHPHQSAITTTSSSESELRAELYRLQNQQINDSWKRWLMIGGGVLGALILFLLFRPTPTPAPTPVIVMPPPQPIPSPEKKTCIALIAFGCD